MCPQVYELHRRVCIKQIRIWHRDLPGRHGIRLSAAHEVCPAQRILEYIGNPAPSKYLTQLLLH